MENKSESDGYVIRSAARPGFKRELERALQTQSEVSAFSLSRTRSGNKKTRVDIVESSSGEKNKKKKKFESAEELIESGLIDGLMMEYHPKPDEALAEGDRPRAIVSKGRLLCNCGFCKRYVECPIDEFQNHAGCHYWNTIDAIYFETGASFWDVLAACNASPADELESALKKALGSDVRDLAKRVYNCRRCKGSIQTPLDADFRLYCNACLELRRVQFVPVTPYLNN